MSASTATNAACNALRIAGEFREIPDLTQPNDHPLPDIARVAAILAEVESGFTWSEDGRPDWESVCAKLARMIEDGRVVNRRVILSLTKAQP